MKSPFPLLLATFALPALVHAEPQWIWLSKQAKEDERVTLRREFELKGDVKSASFEFTVDNAGTALLNGHKLADNDALNEPTRANAKSLLRAGKNEIRIDAKNSDGIAAAVGTLKIELNDGTKLAIETGPEWQAAPGGGTDFKPAVAIAKYGDGPWGRVFEKVTVKAERDQPAADPATLKTPPGFKVELLYTVPKADQGSWVALTVDPQGRLLASDQHGMIYRVTVDGKGAQVEPLKVKIGGAHGILYAFNSLYVMANEQGVSGLWRLRDTDGKGNFGEPELLRKMEGKGEHGPHQVVVGPDGKSLYFTCGNHTKVPEKMESSRAVAWDEDHLTPRLWDANGHAKNIFAPGGYIARTDPDGRKMELFTLGFRNQYDIAFDQNGELFTFDSDMEWDIGAPWYMPTRINHCVDGGDCGWRSGAGRWPDYYADSLPAALDIGPGSPTGVVFGTGAKFPAKYQRAFYALDWTYGTMYAIHLKPDGASFKGEKEEFVAGKPLPLTDAIIHPKDGAMYFAIGGRKTQSALYRVTYTGTESTAPAPKVEPTAEAKLRHDLEKLHAEGTGPEAITKAWPYLSNKDRFIRWAARVAIERQPAKAWIDKALAEKNPQAALEALIALARVGEKTMQPELIAALGRLDYTTLSPELRLSLLRAWQLAFTRMGKPASEACNSIVAKLDPLFPDADPLANRELISLLVFLDSPRVVAKTVPMLSTAKDAAEAIATDELLARNEGYARAAQAMAASRPNRQAIAYAYALRVAKAGWTPELRKAFFGWFPQTHSWKGGNSFTKFIDNIRTEALAAFVPDEEKAALDELSKKTPTPIAANFVAPKGPGRAYTVDDVVKLVGAGLKGRNFQNGKAMYSATLCASCHHFAGEGGNVGPDLTGSGNRYTIRDLTENILDPSKVVSDQYGSEQIEKKDGSVVIGRVVVEENGKLFVMTSPMTPDSQTAVNESEVKSRKPYPISMMPPGLINSLNSEELLDLIAYLQSGGNPNDKAFTR
jgi:putative heme-binding domain-containing protein